MQIKECEKCFNLRHNFPFSLSENEYHNDFNYCVWLFIYLIFDREKDIVFVLKPANERIENLFDKKQAKLCILEKPHEIIRSWGVNYFKVESLNDACPFFLSPNNAVAILMGNRKKAGERLGRETKIGEKIE